MWTHKHIYIHTAICSAFERFAEWYGVCAFVWVCRCYRTSLLQIRSKPDDGKAFSIHTQTNLHCNTHSAVKTRWYMRCYYHCPYTVPVDVCDKFAKHKCLAIAVRRNSFSDSHRCANSWNRAFCSARFNSNEIYLKKLLSVFNFGLIFFLRIFNFANKKKNILEFSFVI